MQRRLKIYEYLYSVEFFLQYENVISVVANTFITTILNCYKQNFYCFYDFYEIFIFVKN